MDKIMKLLIEKVNFLIMSQETADANELRMLWERKQE